MSLIFNLRVTHSQLNSEIQRRVLTVSLRRGAVSVTAGSVSVFSVGIGFRFFGRFFQKSVSVSVLVFQNIAISVSVFGFSARTYHCLSNNTIADTLCPPLFPEWGLGPRICITNCGHKR